MCTTKKVFSFIVIICLMILFSGINYCFAEYKLTPECKNLYKQWTEVIGFCAIDYVKENDPAPEIKAGLEITPQNAKDYPGLQKILPETIYRRLDPNFFLPIEKMSIVDTRPRYFEQRVIDATIKGKGKVRVNKETLQLEGYNSGIPFVNPTDPLEMVWNQVLCMPHFAENVWFDPITATTYNKARKVDSVWKANFGYYMVQGRLYTDVGPNNVSEYFLGHGELDRRVMLATYPQDVKGTAFLRIKYWDVEKPDYFVSYLPGLKRIRVLSGSDAQDPILGSEMCWDTWGVESQKQPSKTVFPNAYKILGERIVLMPTYPSRPSLTIEGEQIICGWEKRPVWVLEIKSLDPTYVCSKRISYIDKEIFHIIYQDYYDRRGNLWRTWDDFKYLLPNGYCTWESVRILNWISQRDSLFKMNSVPLPPLEPGQFDMRWLIRMAR